MCIFFGHILFLFALVLSCIKGKPNFIFFWDTRTKLPEQVLQIFYNKIFFAVNWNNIYIFPSLSLFPSLFVWVFLNLVLPLKAQQLVKDQLGKTPDKVKYLYYKFPLTIERKRQNILIPKHALLIGRQFCELCFGLWRRDGEYLKAFPFRNFRARKMLILIY